VVGLKTEPWFRLPPYSGTPGASLCRSALPRLIALAAVVPIALSSAACSYKLDSLFSRDGDKSEATGSLAAHDQPTATRAAGSLDADLAFAKAAAAEALGRMGDVSVPWENPGTGARGTVTPLAAAYTQDGFICRDFLASYVRKDSESWLQGEGCRIHQGRWEVRHMKPLQRP
jgi:17 kDa outer membrane surface antigen